MKRSGTLGNKSDNLTSPAGASENLGGKDRVGQQVREGLCHFPAPFQGLLGFVYLNPGLVALGYYPAPLRGSDSTRTRADRPELLSCAPTRARHAEPLDSTKMSEPDSGTHAPILSAKAVEVKLES